MSPLRRIFVPDSSMVICLDCIGCIDLIERLGFDPLVILEAGAEVRRGGRLFTPRAPATTTPPRVQAPSDNP